MAVDIVMPQMGESIFEGTITKWLKKPGDKVERDEPLFEISTDKVDAEIPSPSAGVLKEIKVGEGKTVPIQTVVGVIDAAGGAAAAAASAPAKAAEPAKAAAPAPQQAAKPAAAPPPPPPAAAKPAAPAAQAAPSREGARIHSSPLVRKMAKEHGIDLTAVQGTGTGGRISKQDIEAHLAGGGSSAEAAKQTEPAEADVYTQQAPASTPSYTPPPPPPERQAPPQAPPPASTMGRQHHVAFETAVPRERMYFGNYEMQPMTIMRQRIAEHMIASKHVSPHVYSVDEIDMTKVAAIRAKSRDEFEKRYETKLTYMPFFVKAAVAGLRAYPTMNASLDGTNVVLHKEINVGMAVALDWGLIVPVIKNADEKNILGIQRNLNDLAERARSKKLKPEEVQESTFSITNPGVFGGLFGLPVISQPNVGILGLGAIEKRPVVINDSIAIRSMCYVTLSYDHRVVDGAVAHQFLHKVKDTLENWSESVL
jgi:pyruvate dehydrogenase E2 component (dihydrolipoamide acetyltransferase)